MSPLEPTVQPRHDRRQAQPESPRNRAKLLRWVRKGHAWIGLAGASLGLLFGITGVLLNHRGMLKIEAGVIQEHKVMVELSPLPANAEALAQNLAARFQVPMARVKWRVQPGRPGRLGGAEVSTAELWSVAFTGHAHFALASYTPGNHTVELVTKDADWVQSLKRLHKGDGGQLGWILVTDAFAGALVLLTLSGMLLWTRLAGSKILALGLVTGGALAAALVAARAW